MAGTASISWINNSSNTYATWDPSNKASNITLSNGDLTAVVANGVAGMMRSTIGKSSGKWYWEVTLTDINLPQGSGGGIAKSTSDLNNYIGFGADSWAFWFSTGDKLTNNSLTGFSTSPANGDILGFALDMDGGTISVYKNNTLLGGGAMFSSISGTLYAGWGTNNANYTITANFGATTMTYTAPSGYNQGLYN